MFYISLVVTTKQNYTIDSQKIKGRESNVSLRKIINSQRKGTREKEMN